MASTSSAYRKKAETVFQQEARHDKRVEPFRDSRKLGMAPVERLIAGQAGDPAPHVLRTQP